MEERTAGISQSQVLFRSVPKARRESRLGDFRTLAPTLIKWALLCVESSLKLGNRLMTHERLSRLRLRLAISLIRGLLPRFDVCGRSQTPTPLSSFLSVRVFRSYPRSPAGIARTNLERTSNNCAIPPESGG